MTADRIAEPVGAYKPRILQFLWDHRKTTRRPPYSVAPTIDVVAIAAGTGLPLHDVVHVVYSLQKQDAIRFRERKRATRPGIVGTVAGVKTKTTPARSASMPGGGANLDTFQITAAGEALRMRLDQKTDDALARDDPAMRVVAKSVPAGVIVREAEIEAHRVATAIRDEAPAPEPTFIEHLTGRAPAAATPPEAVPAPDTRPALPDVLAAVLARYAARQKVRAAADALEAAGLPDQAIAILDQIPWSDLEDAIAEHLTSEGYGSDTRD